jgi:hypothetical protein
MPKLNRAARALVAAEARTTLAALVEDDAYAVALPCSTSPEACAIYSPRNAFAEPVAHASRSAIACALRKGWLAHDQTRNCLHISPAGLQALRAGERNQVRNPTSTKLATARPAEARKRPAGESALVWLRSRRDKNGGSFITDPQFNAGEKLAADYWRAQLSPRVTANWSAAVPGQRTRRSAPGAGVEISDAAMAARRRVQHALEAVGPELAGILVDVCCHELGLEAAGHAAGWPQRGAARVVLELALTRLARHYGLIAPERPAANRMRHWGDENFRPTIEAWR